MQKSSSCRAEVVEHSSSVVDAPSLIIATNNTNVLPKNDKVALNHWHSLHCECNIHIYFDTSGFCNL